MKIIIRSLQGDEYIVDVRNDQSVLDLKATISEQPNGPAVSKQKLVYKGTTMQESNLLNEYNLEEGCKVHLILKKEYPKDQQTSVHTNISVDPTTASTNSLSSSSDKCVSSGSSSSNRIETNNANSSSSQSSTTAPLTNDPKQSQNRCNQPQSRFEVILRERLAEHFDANSVEKIMANLENEINADINSSSLDDLERLAKQKLNISNE